MKRSRKTVFALLLALVMVLCLAAAAGAAEVGGTEGGDGIVVGPVGPGNYPTLTELEIPFIKTVKLGSNTGPGTTDFTIAVCHVNAHGLSYYTDVTYKVVITTNGAGSYNGELVISGPAEKVSKFVSEGFYVREVNDGLSEWTYSDAVWYVSPEGEIFPARMETTDNGDSYDAINNADTVREMTFENVYTENLRTVEIPFTKTVKLGGNTGPGETVFTIAVCHVNAHGLSYYTDVTYKVVITTNGAGSYDGKLIISGPAEKVSKFVSEGFYVREVNDGLSEWTYSDAVWYVSPEGEIFPARMETTDNGDSYDAINNADAESKMTFENTYTYNTSYTTPDVKPTSAPKTFDAGVALYGVSALLSLTGTALVIKRKKG